jgi:biotin carboxyl carrier protein
LKVGGDVLVGLKRWETLVAKTAEVDKLLSNMPDELEAALAQKGKLITMADVPDSFTPAQIHTALGYQQKGLDFAKVTAQGKDLNPLLCAPHILHGKPRSTPAGTQFELLHDPSRVNQREVIQFDGFGKAPNGDLMLNFLHEGVRVPVQAVDPDAVVGAKVDSGPRKATPGNRLELPCAVPGEVLVYNVKPGDVLEAGAPLVVLESMKMEMKISVPDELDGLKVKALPCKIRTKEFQGDILAPGDLLLELEE